MTVVRRPDPIPLGRTKRIEASRALQAVRPESDDLHHLVARRIFAAIVAGDFPEGSILPNEHRLSEDLGVSRTALREAVKGLASKGMVETRRRRGTMVLDRTRWNMLDAEVMSWSRRAGAPELVSRQLWEAFLTAQPALAALAAERRAGGSPRRAALRLREAPAADRAAAFAEFHVQLALAAANPYLTSLTVACLDNLLGEDASFLVRAMETIDVQRYSALVDLISTGRADEAAHAMREILERTHTFAET